MARAARREQSMKMRQAMMTGDDSGLPPRDKGPVRRYVRDFVDARLSIGTLAMPMMIVVLVLTFINDDQAANIRHSVTTCAWPCNGKYVGNYPLADGAWGPTIEASDDQSPVRRARSSSS